MKIMLSVNHVLMCLYLTICVFGQHAQGRITDKNDARLVKKGRISFAPFVFGFSFNGTIKINPRGKQVAKGVNLTDVTGDVGNFSRVDTAIGLEIKENKNVSSDNIPPGRVSDLTVTEEVIKGASRIVVRFTAPGDHDKGKISHYELCYFDGAVQLLTADFNKTCIRVKTETNLPPKDEGKLESFVMEIPKSFKNSSSISFFVRAFDKSGNAAPPSNTAVVKFGLIKPATTGTPTFSRVPTEKRSTKAIVRTTPSTVLATSTPRSTTTQPVRPTTTKKPTPTEKQKNTTSYIPRKGLWCLTCNDARSNAECKSRGKLKKCQNHQKSCSTVVRRQGKRKTITKRCAQTNACHNEQKQNFGQNGQCNFRAFNSVCRCCCKKNLCNEQSCAGGF